MWPILFKGILLGFSLSFLIGPLLFALVQTSFEHGLRAGFHVAFGIWMSDLMFVIVVLGFVTQLEALVHFPNFEKLAGAAGGFLLIIFGLINFKQKKTTKMAEKMVKSSGLWGYFMRGFLINTINPFTVFFWLGITSTVLVPNHWTVAEVTIFFAGMLGTLILTDSLKVFLAQKISCLLTPKHIEQFRLVLGFLFVFFGIVLIVRTL